MSENLSRRCPPGVFLFFARDASIALLKRVRSAEGSTTMTLSRDEMLELSLAFVRAVAMAERAHLDAQPKAVA